MRFSLVAAVLLATLLTGCFGGESRSDWAYEVTGLGELNAEGLHGRNLRIGVLDTGVNTAHPSLDHLVDGDPSNGELVGFQDHVRRRMGVDQAYDDSGHGTHVIGIMAARGSSLTDKLLYGGIDLAGGAREALYYVAKVCDVECPPDAIAAALRWLGQEDVDVVSLSLGGERQAGIVINDEIRNEIDALIDDGVAVIASAGNDGAQASDVSAPADLRGVIAVGAIDESGRVAGLSSHGDNDGFRTCRGGLDLTGQARCDPHRKPEIVAPGINILSTWTGDSYARASGTSQAAPFVASAVALMLEGHTKPTARSQVDCIKEVLMQTAQPIPGQATPHDDAAGYGILRADRARDAYDCT